MDFLFHFLDIPNPKLAVWSSSSMMKDGLCSGKPAIVFFTKAGSFSEKIGYNDGKGIALRKS